MIELMQELAEQFREVNPESYHEINTAENVVYPYITYGVDGEYIERQSDGFNIDVDIFDTSASYTTIFELEAQLKDHFRMARVMTDDMFIMFEYLRSNTIETGDKTIKRRNVQLYARVDWRKK